MPLPEVLPQKLNSPLVLEGNDWTDLSQWEFTLSAEQRMMLGRIAMVSHVEPFSCHAPCLYQRLSFRLQVSTIPSGAYPPEPYSYPPQTRPARPLQGSTHRPRLRPANPSHGRLLPRRQHPRLSRRAGPWFRILLAHTKDLIEPRLLKIDAAAYTTDKQVLHTDIGDIPWTFMLHSRMLRITLMR
jgi:hypothetical protein